MKKLLSCLLAILLLCSTVLFAACSDETVQDAADDVPATDTPVEDEDDGELLPLELPTRDFAGETVHILQWSVSGVVDAGTGWIPWEEGDVPEDHMGSMMEQAVFSRNAWVEEQMGITITAEYISVNQGYDTRLRQDYSTSANEFQLATLRSRNVWPLIESGIYMDMNQYAGDILHTDMPWWPEDAVASYTLGDALYVCVTEMLLRDKGATSCVFFNTRIAEDYDLTYFYDFVESNEWTMEIMITAAEIAATSQDGDGMINTAQDLWGVEGGEASYQLFAGGGYKFAHIDEQGNLAYDFGSSDTILAMQRIYEEYMYQDWNYISHMPVADHPENGLFINEKALFANMGIKNGYLDYRQMETDYGILPVPMLTGDEGRYYSLVAVHHDAVVGIPAGAADPELAATALEMLSYEGYYSVAPVLYETMLLNRLAKSEESKRSLEIVFETRVYDPGQYWDLENNLQGGNGFFRLSQTGNANIASVWASWEEATMEQIDLVNNFIASTRQ